MSPLRTPGLCLALVIVPLAGAATLLAADEPSPVTTRVRPLVNPLFPVGESHSNLSGTTSDLTVDPENDCFGSTPDDQFQSGDVAAVNVFWDDTVEADLVNDYQVTWAGMLPSGRRVTAGPFLCSYDLSISAQPGDPAQFCCSLHLTVKPVPGSITIDWGARVDKVEGGDRLQGQLGSASVSP